MTNYRQLDSMNYKRSRVPSEVVQKTREMVKEAFKSLRKQGLIARGNFLCCGSCAGYSIANDYDQLALKTQDQSKWPRGCVYWHKQDDERFWSTGRLHLRYGQIKGSESKAETTPTTHQVGLLVLVALRTAGLEREQIEWDGNPDSTIVVVAKEPVLASTAMREAGVGI